MIRWLASLFRRRDPRKANDAAIRSNPLWLRNVIIGMQNTGTLRRLD